MSVVAVDFATTPQGRVVAEGDPGPAMVTALDSLRTAALTDDELVAMMAAWRRVTSWAQSCELAAVAELVRRREQQHPTGHPAKVTEAIADEIALALTLSGGAAGTWAGLACRLTETLPLTYQALAKGRIDLPRAKVIADGLLGVDRRTSSLVEQAVIEAAQCVPAARLRRRVRATITAIDPEAAEERRQRARKVRSLEMWATAAGTCELALREVSAEDAEAIYNRIDATAQSMRADGDARPIDAIRHDLGVALLRGIPLPEAARDLRATDAEPATGGPPQAHHSADPRSPAPCDPGNEHSASASAPARPATDHPAGSRPRTEHPTDGSQSSGHADTGHSTTHRPSTGSQDPCPGTVSPDSPTGPVPEGPTRQPTGSTGRQRRADRAGPGGGPDSSADTAADAAAHLARMLAEVIDERLNLVADRHDATGHRTGRAPRITAAMQAMSSALTDLKHHWCQTTAWQGQAGKSPDAQHHDRDHHGHHGYRPPAWMRRLVERAHQTCAFPTCDRPAATCDLDHTLAWHRGGPTCPCNLAPLCRRHHKVKQHPQWRLFQPWPGLLVWLTPAGTWYIHRPGP